MTCRRASQDPSVTEPQRDGGGVADGEGSTVRKEPSHPLSRELSHRESLWKRASSGVWALPDAFVKQMRNWRKTER